MHSIGIIGGKPAPNYVHLQDMAHPQGGSSTSNLSWLANGAVTYYSTSSGGANLPISGIWWTGPAGTPGNSYDIRITLQSGSGITGTFNTWQRIDGSNGFTTWATNNSGRVLVEIRNATTLAVVASCRIWRGASHAP